MGISRYGSWNIRSGFLVEFAGTENRHWDRGAFLAPNPSPISFFSHLDAHPLSDLDAHPRVDLSIDGADEVDPFLNLVKGRGGSLLREKMIESASSRFVVIVDDSKLVPRLGASALAVPVEVVPFCHHFTLTQLNSLFNQHPHFSGAKLRTADTGAPFVTDNSNYIVDLYFDEGITGDLNAISDDILRLTGVVEHGMFLGIATQVIVANKDGGVLVLNNK